MDDNVKKFLYDISVSIDSIDSYIGEKKEFITYQKNKMLRRSVERELEIIGEAVSKITKIDPTIIITSKEKIISLRNRVIHAYDKIDDAIVWGVVIKYLPILKIEVDNLLK